jgi:hypothetical protein
VEALQPRVVVELGVHSGNSYCAFLQAVQFLALPAQCYGIDHWRGDEHSAHYGDEVYAELCAHHDPLYGTFSTLIRSTFEAALPYFSDRSIDLLHIDGFHTYDAAAKDLSDWLPKMSARGVVLFHDITVRERDFGVWRLWEEIAARYQTVAFIHSYGLGLAYVGTEPPPVPLATLLARSDPDSIGGIRSYFARLGASLVDRFERHRVEETSQAELAVLQEQLTTAGAEGGLQVETSAGLQRTLAESRAELEAARAEIGRQLDAAGASLIASTGMTEQIAALGEEVSRARARSSEAIAQRERATQLLRQQITATAGLQRGLTAATSELAHHTEVAVLREANVQKASDRIACLESELEAARAETARQQDAASASHRASVQATEQIAALGEELLRARSEIAEREKAAVQAAARAEALGEELLRVRADVSAAIADREKTAVQAAALGEDLDRVRGQMSQAIADREQATERLQQEITATAGLQRELAALRQTEAITALVTRVAAVKHVIPRPIRRYVKNRLLGLRPPRESPTGSQ